MSQASPRRVAYLFGAGATHAELQNLKPDLEADREGLLIGHVSSRVIRKARRAAGYLSGVEMVSSTSGSLNIELLISLMENSKVDGWARKTELLKELVKQDIQTVLSKPRLRAFYLHKALFEMHKHRAARSAEKPVGFISLNYDGVLDLAYKEFFGNPNYCFCLDDDDGIPLLKLHGSFEWNNKVLRGRRRSVDIIPLGSNKTYMHVPYSFIWGRALEILTTCDVLRVIGCGLSQNDAHLIDLLFKAHLEQGRGFEMEIIGPVAAGESIKQSFGFFPGIRTLVEVEGALIPERSPDNPFKTWLKYKALRVLGARPLRQTKYLRKVVS